MVKQNFSVKSIIRTDKRKLDGTYPINYIVTINSRTVKFSSGLYVENQNWNGKDGTFKGSKSSYDNCILEKEISKIKDFLKEQRSIGTFLDLDLVKSFYSTKDSDDFYEFYDLFCKEKFKSVSEGRQYHYQLTRKRLKQFKDNIRLSQINENFISSFDDFLKYKSEVKESGRNNMHKNLKAVLKDALRKKKIQSNVYEGFKFNKEESVTGYLNSIELKLIEKKRFSNFPRGCGLNITRDMFLFSCYSGLRYSDVIKLTKSDFADGENLNLRMQKTKNMVTVPLTNKAKEILKKYAREDNKPIFPSRSNVCVNRDLKSIASSCKIKKRVHFHLARHTFATLIAISDPNAFKVMKLLGHKDIRMTQRYVDIDIEELSNTLKGIAIFN